MLLTEEQAQIWDAARDFAQAHWHRFQPDGSAKRFPARGAARHGQARFYGMTVPAEWDGAGTDYIAYALAMEEIAAGDGAVSTIMSGHNSVGCMPLVDMHPGAEEKVSAADGARRNAKRLLPHRAAERLGCRRDSSIK